MGYGIKRQVNSRKYRLVIEVQSQIEKNKTDLNNQRGTEPDVWKSKQSLLVSHTKSTFGFLSLKIVIHDTVFLMDKGFFY